MADFYYIQNVDRGYIDGCLLWWKEGDRGYTTLIAEARKFTAGEASKLCYGSGPEEYKKYKMWPVDYIDVKRLFDTVKNKDVNHKEAQNGEAG